VKTLANSESRLKQYVYSGYARPLLKVTLFDDTSYKEMLKSAATTALINAALWTAAGSYFFSKTKTAEFDADIYASHAMHSPKAMEDALMTMDRTHINSQGLKGEKENIFWAKKEYEALSFVFDGPVMGFLQAMGSKDPHMTISQRVAYLEEDYATNNVNRPTKVTSIINTPRTP
jgi:Zn-dependent protease with chaperone function